MSARFTCQRAAVCLAVSPYRHYRTRCRYPGRRRRRLPAWLVRGETRDTRRHARLDTVYVLPPGFVSAPVWQPPSSALLSVVQIVSHSCLQRVVGAVDFHRTRSPSLDQRRPRILGSCARSSLLCPLSPDNVFRCSCSAFPAQGSALEERQRFSLRR